LYDPAGPARKSRARQTVLLSAALLAVVAAAGIFLAFRFVAAERERDLAVWQVRLGIVADSRAAAVDEWIEQQFTVMRDLAENASLQIYLTEMALAAGDQTKVTDVEAQTAYLRNLITATAEREGFAGGPASAVPANVSRVGTAGIVLLDARLLAIAASPGLPPLDGRLREFIGSRRKGERAFLDMHAGPAGEPLVGFLQPVFAVQADSGTQEIGAVFGIRPVGRELARRLVQPGETSGTAETYLVRRNGNVIDYLSPLRDGTPALARSLAADTANLAAAFALQSPGGFAERTDYAARRVLVTARQLSAAPWTLVRKVDSSDALADTLYRGRVVLFTIIGAIVLVLVVIVAVWRHGTSLRAAESAERFRGLADRFAKLSSFMKVVTDAQSTAIFAVNAREQVTFANLLAGRAAGLPPEDLVGKRLDALLGPARAAPLEALNRAARDGQTIASSVQNFGIVAGSEDRIIKTQHIPMQAAEDPGSVLVVAEDITDLMKERTRREGTLNQLVDTLVTLVDRRDPYAANHSVRVAEVARAVAGEMALPAAETATARIAAALMNVGKILVPTPVLTKTERLSEDEMRLVRDSIQTSADLLEGVDFDGPVAASLRQLQEHWDGSGSPAGLAGEAILLPARIVAVANAFVAMTSPRSWRPGLDFNAAIAELLKQSGVRWDRRVVIALVNVLENRGARERWAHFGRSPDAGAPP
jgi:HD-GYP domain-containing protein (c-di-GMP phosphodiesterase class II)